MPWLFQCIATIIFFVLSPIDDKFLKENESFGYNCNNTYPQMCVEYTYINRSTNNIVNKTEKLETFLGYNQYKQHSYDYVVSKVDNDIEYANFQVVEQFPPESDELNKAYVAVVPNGATVFCDILTHATCSDHNYPVTFLLNANGKFN